MAETSGLLNRHRGLNLYHGFESRPLRQFLFGARAPRLRASERAGVLDRGVGRALGVGVGPGRPGEDVHHAQGNLDVGQAAREDPPVAVGAAALEDFLATRNGVPRTEPSASG